MKFEAVIYFDGPLTKFKRAERAWQFKEEFTLRKAIPNSAGETMPKPDDREVVQRKVFRFRVFAFYWILTRLHGTSHLYGEVYPL